MFTRQLLNKIYRNTNKINQEAGKEYIILNHRDKVWIMPEDSLKMAMDMYQPSTFKGKILKCMIFVFRSNNLILQKLGCEKAGLECNDSIKRYIETAVGNKNLYIATYMGDTSSRQNNKATLQVYDEAGLICYAKVTEDEDVAKTFEREIGNLKYLKDRNINNIPEVLGNEEIDGLKIFLQSTKKLPNETVQLDFGKVQLDFLKDIADKTKIKMSYQETDFFQSIQYLKEHIEDFGQEQQHILKNAMDVIENVLTEKECEYAFFHGDYTPWNVYYVNKKIYAFDFEYCKKTMPCYMDAFHYLTQLSVLGKQNGAEKTMKLYENYREQLKEYMQEPDKIYICYLLHIISFYHSRTGKQLEVIQDKMEIWVKLLSFLIQKSDINYIHISQCCLDA